MTGRERKYDGKHVISTTTSEMSIQSLENSANMAQVAPMQASLPNSPKSKSDPSTPNLRPQPISGYRASPANVRSIRQGSPPSEHSDSSQTPPAVRRIPRGCKFEAGMAQAKRRIPYSCGPEALEPELKERKKALGPEQDARLTSDMQELYSQLLPPPESEAQRSNFVKKVQDLLRARWPGFDIQLRVFGSVGNCLGSRESDIDICITTDCKEMEAVCLVAELLERHGMQRIVCVSSAKIPIVKAWDPEYQVACDINVNNPVALENTSMIRSYVELDERVRPLAMIVKYWAKRRILNDAALGGTLSSYTWICMVLNFLQTRTPPILPALQQKPKLEPVILRGVNVTFDKDLASYKNFGSKNTSSLGELLFQFFRYYGHEFDYEENVLSIRMGKVIPKSQKAWHLLQDNRLGVEEPFNTTRNLANTADDTSMRGIHLEIRRAFRLAVEGDLATCCEQFVPGPEEHKQTATFVHPVARPIIPQPPTQPSTSNQTQRGGRNNYRGSRGNRSGAARRSSNPTSRNPNYLHDLPFQMTPQELQLQAQHQQHLLHDQLFQQYQYLQLQEQELRMQLYQQSMRQKGLMAAQAAAQNFQTPSSNGDHGMRLSMPRTTYQARYNTTSPFLGASSPATGVMTNPASPLLSNSNPDSRRFARRTSMAASSIAGSMRAQSQPARPIAASGTFNHVRLGYNQPVDQNESTERRSSIASPVASHVQHISRPYLPYRSESGTLYDAGRRPAEFVGYYVGQSPSLAAHSHSAAISPLPSHAGLAIHHGGMSPGLSAHTSRIASATSSSPSQTGAVGDSLRMLADQSFSEHPDSPKMRYINSMTNGGITSPKRRQVPIQSTVTSNDHFRLSTSTSDDLGVETPSTSEDQFHDFGDKPGPSLNGYYGPTQMMTTLPEQLENLALIQMKNGVAKDTEEDNAAKHGTEEKELHEVTHLSMKPADSGFANSEAESSSINGVGGRRKKQKAEKTNNVPNSNPSHALTTKTNGRDVTSSGVQLTNGTDHSGWQLSKKSRKKTRKPAKSEGDSTALNDAGGEVRPLDESLRKGG